jgi:hypothetical protein
MEIASAAAGRPPNGRLVAPKLSQETPLSRFVARIELLVAARGDPKRLAAAGAQQHSPARSPERPFLGHSRPIRGCAEIPLEQLGSIVSSPQQRRIVEQYRGGTLGRPGRGDQDRPEAAAARLCTPQQWIASNKDLLEEVHRSHSAALVPGVGQGRGGQSGGGGGGMFRQKVRSFGLRTIGARQSAAVERALQHAVPVEVLLRQQRASASSHRVL